MGTDKADLDAKVARVAVDSGTDEDRVRKGYTVSTPSEITAQLGALQDLGCVHVQAYFPDSAWGDSLQLFASDVIAALP